MGHDPLRWAVLAPLADERGDHAEVHARERGEGAEVDEGGRGGHAQLEGDEPDRPCQQHVDRRRVEPGVEVAEDPLGEDGVAAHGVKQARHAGLGGQAGGKLGDDEAGEEQGREQVPADGLGDREGS